MEMTFRNHFCQWNLLSSAGLRYARIDFFSSQREKTQGEDSFSLDTATFESYGPTVAIEARRPFCCGLTPYVIARGSLLAGNYNFVRDKQNFNEYSDYYYTRRFAEITHTIELQIGAELCGKPPMEIWSWALHSKASFGTALGQCLTLGVIRKKTTCICSSRVVC